MKKILVFAIAAMISVCASAKGLYVGGQAGFWHESDDRSSVNTLSILPEIGYNLSDEWAIGSTIGYEMSHVCGWSSTHIFEISPYARYTYFKSNNGLVSLFLDGGAGVGLGWTHYKGGDDSDTACIWNIGIKPGVALNLSKNVSFVAHIGMLGYQGANDAARDGGYKSEGGLLLNGNNISLGFYVNF